MFWTDIGTPNLPRERRAYNQQGLPDGEWIRYDWTGAAVVFEAYENGQFMHHGGY